MASFVPRIQHFEFQSVTNSQEAATGPVVRALGRSEPVLASGLDLFLVVPHSTLSPTGCLLPVGVLNHVSVKYEKCLSNYQKVGCL